MLRAAALVAGLLLAGCLGAGEPDPPIPGDPSTVSASTTTGPGEPGACCITSEWVRFRIDIASPGPFAIAVPFPHLDWCLGPDAWLVGTRTLDGVGNAEWREIDRGDVLWVDGDGGPAAFHELTLNVTMRGRCQTLRYDPWSIEPDLANGTAEAFGASQRGRILTGYGNATTTEDTPTTPATVQVTVEHQTATCVRTSRFEGTVGNDAWAVLSGTNKGVCPQ